MGIEAVADRPVVAASTPTRADRFRSLMEGALDGAYRRAAMLLGDRLEAEDAVHDAAEKAWRGWTGLRDEDRFDAWFARILVNTCRDRLRRRSRVRLVEIRADEGLSVVVASAEIDAIDARDRVRQALDRLSPDERIAVALRYEADMTIPAIARVVGIPEGTVKTRLHRALGRLRQAMGGTDG